MNDLPFIFYRPRDMYLDTMGMTKEGKIAHRQLADYTWFNDGPPLNDNDTLRDLTTCTAADWGRVKRELVGKGWVETPKFFLHKGIVKTLNYSKEKAVESYNKTCTANRLPRRSLLPPDSETGVTHYVTSDDESSENSQTSPPLIQSKVPKIDTGSSLLGNNQNPNVTYHVTSDVTPTNREGEGNRDKKEGEGAREVPDFEQAFAQTVNAAIPEKFCRYVYDDWSSRSGKDGGGNLVQWLPYVVKRWTREQVEWKAETHKGNRNENAKPNRSKGIDRNDGTYNAKTSSDGLKSKVR